MSPCMEALSSGPASQQLLQFFERMGWTESDQHQIGRDGIALISVRDTHVVVPLMV